MLTTSAGAVARWSSEQGWGLIESPDVPGRIRFDQHSLWALRLPLGPGESIMMGEQGWFVDIGETVDVDWEKHEDSGFHYRAVSVRPRRQPHRRTLRFFVDGVRRPWPVNRFGAIPYPEVWTEG